MSDTIIKVENLGKKYTITHEGKERYTALRDVISNNVKGLFKSKRQRLITGEEEEFWALKDVNFEIKQGDAVGIIGRNGAGKSTLLKILSRITEPSTGKITINGRVASLLEVGTGFHPELTGRENIYLNGAILGMSRIEIKKKFDEIVDFSGVEKFLDTPVKRYSSGMYVRLAFAVAAHLEPEILVVDEVLAVGDAEFQKKCLGKMDDVSKKEGRTVLFVSHQLEAVRSLCSNGILLDKGEISITDKIDKTLSFYMNNRSYNTNFPKTYENVIKINEFLFFQEDDKFIFKLSFDLLKKEKILNIAVIITTQLNIRIAIIDLRKYLNELNTNLESAKQIIINTKSINLVEGTYKLGLFLATGDFWKTFEDINEFEFVEKDGFSPQSIIKFPKEHRGFFNLDLTLFNISE